MSALNHKVLVHCSHSLVLFLLFLFGGVTVSHLFKLTLIIFTHIQTNYFMVKTSELFSGEVKLYIFYEIWGSLSLGSL